MTRSRAPAITHDHASDGTPITLVPLANTAALATVDTADFAILERLKISLAWTFNPNSDGRGYVRVGAHGVVGNLFSVARIIAQAPVGQVVRYRDGNTLNLRRENLYFVKSAHSRIPVPERWRFPEPKDATTTPVAMRTSFSQKRTLDQAVVVRRKTRRDGDGVAEGAGVPA